jgi:hypothetical protein
MRKVGSAQTAGSPRSSTAARLPMISGAHAIVYSKNPEADRGFFREVLGLPHVDVGEGWLIFALPPAEVAVHPGDKNDVHELYLMVDDLTGLITELERRGVPCATPRNLGWGVLIHVTLPGGGRLGVYQPRHARAMWPRPTRARARPATGRRREGTRSRGRTRRRT